MTNDIEEWIISVRKYVLGNSAFNPINEDSMRWLADKVLLHGYMERPVDFDGNKKLICRCLSTNSLETAVKAFSRRMFDFDLYLFYVKTPGDGEYRYEIGYAQTEID